MIDALHAEVELAHEFVIDRLPNSDLHGLRGFAKLRLGGNQNALSR